MGKLKGDIFEYLNWHKKHLKLGIDIRDVREMKIFLFGYSKGINEVQRGRNFNWVDDFNEFTERTLQDKKPSSYDWSRYIYENQSDEEDGLKKFYSLMDQFIESQKKEG